MHDTFTFTVPTADLRGAETTPFAERCHLRQRYGVAVTSTTTEQGETFTITSRRGRGVAAFRRLHG